MTRLLYILSILIICGSCIRYDEQPTFQTNYSYAVEGWESLGTQTLVLLAAENTSSKHQKVKIKVDVINEEGQVFSKDTTIDFAQNERHKNFQLIVETEGIIKDVKVYSIQ